LPYEDEVTDTSHFAELKDLPEAGEEELALMSQIVDKMTTDLYLNIFHDSYKERIEALVKSKMKRELAQVEAKRPKKRPWMIEPQELPAFLACLYNIFLTLLLSYHVFKHVGR
jgi:non-homologous end joining protein Ku